MALPRVIRVPLRARDGSVRAWALLDEQDAHLAEQRWCLDGDGYAVRTVHRPGQTKRMHRIVLDAPRHLEVDHINGDPLDNRRENLRLVTNAQQRQNAVMRTGKSRRRGVRFVAQRGTWTADVQVNGKRYHLGSFLTEQAAADAAARFRRRNMPYSVEGR